MSRYIDADKLNVDFYDEYETKDDEYTYAYVSKSQIDSAPSIDIVRCKECRHRSYCYSEVHMTNKKQTTSICKDIDFCSYGERKESE